MPSDNASGKQVRTIVISKETSQYRIVTDDPDNWRIVANRSFAQGELLEPIDDTLDIDVRGVDYVDVVLEETQEKKRVYSSISAVPCDGSCAQVALEIPWCFMNHSCAPNVRDLWIKEPKDIAVFAGSLTTRAIADGEEITYDYALEQYQYAAPFECQCGVDSCRGTISGFCDLSRKEQGRLLSHASPYVQDKFRSEFVRKQVNVSSFGRHLVVDYWDCDADLLNDEARLVEILALAADAAGATVMAMRSHKFEGQGVTAVAILAESHISIHTWPDAGYAGVDIYTCGSCDPLKAYSMLEKALSSGRAEYVEILRGRGDEERSILPINNEPPLRSGLEQDGAWFYEGSVPGRRYCKINHGFSVTDVVLKEHSKFQDYLVFDNPAYGRVLVLDGIVQLSTYDEYIYHDMLVHPPLFAHPNPKRVLIVGGGDGGTLREVLKHNPDEVVMIDIDEQFVRNIAACFPSVHAGSFEDARLTLLFEDASEALKRYENAFDVAIIDCNDGVGPSEILFGEEFYATVACALKKDGVCSAQAGSMMDLEHLENMRQLMTNQIGPTTGFKLTIPVYHCGEYVFFVSSNSCDPSGPAASILAERQAKRSIVTRYWSPTVHHASQVLPPDSTLW